MTLQEKLTETIQYIHNQGGARSRIWLDSRFWFR